VAGWHARAAPRPPCRPEPRPRRLAGKGDSRTRILREVRPNAISAPNRGRKAPRVSRGNARGEQVRGVHSHWECMTHIWLEWAGMREVVEKAEPER